jgi:hypothetical protein
MELALNRKQLKQLNTLMERFPDTEWFTLYSENESGIGPSMYVKFNLFGDEDKDEDTQVNITDVSTW